MTRPWRLPLYNEKATGRDDPSRVTASQRSVKPRGAGHAGLHGRRGRQRAYFDTGIVNSAPLGVLSGQRCITDFCRV